MGKVIVQSNSYRTAVRNLPDVDICAYHSDTLSEVKADLDREPQGKPVMVVTDGAHLKGATCQPDPDRNGVDAEAGETIAKTAKAKGGHYEHLLLGMDRKVEACGVAYRAGWADMTFEERDTLKRFYPIASKLSPRGELARAGDKLTWNGAPVTLIGASFYGSLTSNQVDYIGWLDALSMHKLKAGSVVAGCNMTRVWLTNQWAACKSACLATRPKPGYGVSPFVESGDDLAGRYDLDTTDEKLIVRLVEYVKKAWDEGIVVVVTHYERNGLRNVGASYKGWSTSPYNAKNSKPGQGLAQTAGSDYPVDFLGCTGDEATRAKVRGWHRKLSARVVEALAPYGNVIHEICNEPESRNNVDEKWGEHIASFHKNIAAIMRDPNAVWSCGTIEAPVPPPGDLPPLGEPVVFAKPGVFLIGGPDNHNFPLYARDSTGKLITGTFRRIEIDFDLYVGRWDPSIKKAHCLIWALFNNGSPFRGQRQLAYVNAFEGQGFTRNQIKWGGDKVAADGRPTVKPGQNVHFHWHYDSRLMENYFSITLAGQSTPFVQKGVTRNSGPVPVTKNWYMEFGTQNALIGPEAKTYGWKWSDLVVRFFQ